MGVRRKYIRDVAESLLRKYKPKDGPISAAAIARALGIHVKLETVDDDLSGFLYRDTKTKRAVIGANAAHHQNRVNFTIAHELGHYLLHETETAHLDTQKPGYMIQRRDKKSATGEDLNEREANLFAAELLMPAKSIEQDLRGRTVDLFSDDEFLKDLAKKYGVSTRAITVRLTYLGYIHV